MNANNDSLFYMCNGIPMKESFVKIDPINKGLSGDKKYHVETGNGQVLLLRVSDIETYEGKKTMYDMMKRAAALGVSMSRPVDFGICNGGKNVYQLLSWCDGDTADIVLPTLSETEQYTLGVKAGQNLRLIHSIQAPDGLKDWYDSFIRINDGRLRSFFGCGVPINGSDIILAYYEENRHSLRGRPQCFIHGDYHNENLLISRNREMLIDGLFASFHFI